jgi:hypothetical protein
MIVGRVLAGFGLGVLPVRYFPQAFIPLGIPALFGVACFAGSVMN